MKFVYLFKEGDSSMRNLLGGKGANLCEMTRLGLPVPQGFVVSTEACLNYYEKGGIAINIKKQILNAIKYLEKITKKQFGNPSNPLLLSVRSGARVSMPGMMDTILNLGLNDEITKSFAGLTGNKKFAYDCYRRFIQMYSDVVKEINSNLFEKAIDKLKKERKIKLDQDFTATDFQTLIKEFKKIYKNETKEPFPQDVHELLLNCVESVFKSWNNERAIIYRKINNIPGEWGTAVNIQTMVFGNLNEKSGTGVCFSRNPANGQNIFYGEYLMNAQGEDIVAGVRTPNPISQLKLDNERIYTELHNYALKLEAFYKDMQDMEFTIEDDKLYILQTRNGKRTPTARLEIALDLVKEGEIDKKTAISRIEIEKINELLHSSLNITNQKVIAEGIPASPGGACGKIVFSAEKAKILKEQNEKSILVRLETSAEDIEGMSVSEGILTARGGMTSHAAVVARGMGKVCISGCSDLEFVKNAVKIGNKTFKEGDYISLDGTTGKVYGEKIEYTSSSVNNNLKTILSWAKELETIGVRANADNATDANTAFELGASGIGLCRTEHMFFNAMRIKEMRKMIISIDLKERKSALKSLYNFQKQDFTEIFKEANGRPVTIRLLDPPLHEFLPKTEKEIKELASDMGLEVSIVKERIENLKEVNPMMGHRGLRLGITYPEIYEMQTKAILDGAISAQKSTKIASNPEIMIPLTSDLNEFLYVKSIIKSIADKLSEGKEITYKIGTMIETPRAILLASSLAEHCDFFSFGTNDLTQFCYGFSRDDAGKFLKDYYEKGIFKKDVFAHFDEVIGEFAYTAIKSAKRINPNIHIGVCGEHGGDPESIKLFKKFGFDYVSSSLFRVPVAVLTSVNLN